MLGSKNIIDPIDFKNQLKILFQTSDKKLKQMSKESRKSYIESSKLFLNKFKQTFENIFQKINDISMPKILNFPIKNLPNISVVTITYNRRKLFKLAILNFLQTVYPRDKLEWIIVDDGTDKINMAPYGTQIAGEDVYYTDTKFAQDFIKFRFYDIINQKFENHFINLKDDILL